MIEKDPVALWNTVKKHYGKGFFYGCIESEFGITPETHDKLILRFDRRLAEFKKDMKGQLDKMAEVFERDKMFLMREKTEKELEL